MKLNTQEIQALGASVLSVEAVETDFIEATCELDGIQFIETFGGNREFAFDIDSSSNRDVINLTCRWEDVHEVPEVSWDSTSPLATYAKKRFEQVDKAIRGVTSTFEDFSFHSYVFELHSDGWHMRIPSYVTATIDSDSDLDDEISIASDSDDDTPMQPDDVFNSKTGETLREVSDRNERRDNWARAIEYELNERTSSFSRNISSLW